MEADDEEDRAFARCRRIVPGAHSWSIRSRRSHEHGCGHTNLAVVEGVYEALGMGDIEAQTILFSADITVLMPGRTQLPGLYDGCDAVLGFLGRMQAAAGGTYREISVMTRMPGNFPSARG